MSHKEVHRYVKHPRYGDGPIKSGYNYSKNAIENSFWMYKGMKYFAETAIPAETDKQNYSVFPRSVYVDIQETCRTCHRPFIFYALEQKYWYETLQFWIDAHCVQCVDCRKKMQELKKMQQAYQALLLKKDRTQSDNQKLKTIALELCQQGYITNINKVNRIKTC